MARRPFFRDHRTGFLVGTAAFLVGWACWYDAYDRRGRDTPRVLRPFTWW